MAGDTDLDLALAIALAEASDGYSDDDFKPSSREVELRQLSLFAKCSTLQPTKSTRTSRSKRQKTQTAAAADEPKSIGAQKTRQRAAHVKHRNGQKDVKNQLTRPEVDVGGIEKCAKSDTTVQGGKQDNLFHSFRYQAPQRQEMSQPVREVEEGSSVVEVQQVSESVTNQNKSSSSEKPEDEDEDEDEDLIFTISIGSPEANQPNLHDVDALERNLSVSNGDKEELITDSRISRAGAPGSDEITRLGEESQFSALLRLCTEEGANQDQSNEHPQPSEVVGSQSSGRRGSQLGVVAVPELDSVTDAHASRVAHLDDAMDDISYLMTQQRVPEPARIESSDEGCFSALQDITNLSGRSQGNDDHGGIISGTGCVTIFCPICGDDLIDVSLELRVKHTEMCLNKVDEPQECARDPDELIPISRDPSVSFGCEKVKQWLESLNLSRYLDSFNQHEIDWDTLQWLTDEDLLLIGVTSLGPRRKIIGAFQGPKSGKRTETPELSASRLEDDTLKNAQASSKDSTKLITNFFPIAAGTGRPEKCETNVVKQKVVVTKHGSTSRMAPNRPRIAQRPNIRGVPAWMCIPGTPFRVDAFQHLSGDCSHWFLTHFHTDHYQGLTRGFRYGRIFCSAITARLVNLRIGVSWDRLMIVPLNEKFKICGVDVTFIDANHCPGSVMILFEPPNGEVVLHTGDFRFCSAMADNAVLQSATVHTLILDTTYCDPQYDFPKQESVIQFVIEAIQAEAFNRDTLFLIGTYTIGKERVFLEVGKVLQKKIYVGSAKMKLLECMDLSAEDSNWLTSNDRESFIHVVPLWSISSFKRMSSISRHYHADVEFDQSPGSLIGSTRENPGSFIVGNVLYRRLNSQTAVFHFKVGPCGFYLGRYKLIVAFSPTGWSFGRGKKKTPGKRHQQGTMIRYEVPYSEHSSFCELKEFVKFIAPLDIIPSVPGKSGSDDMIANLWSEDH